MGIIFNQGINYQKKAKKHQYCHNFDCLWEDNFLSMNNILKKTQIQEICNHFDCFWEDNFWSKNHKQEKSSEPLNSSPF